MVLPKYVMIIRAKRPPVIYAGLSHTPCKVAFEARGLMMGWGGITPIITGKIELTLLFSIRLGRTRLVASDSGRSV